ncbi:hypothetical protein KDK95_12595 [Actinospica sp. MGRD01-02]|uniref:Uncharacterized protein n=1 Tax=Actinospica acidithermotolerans TaxID=2828514 RepID=A0A941EAZ4_9ACTN|nr:DUF6159 family protein [Actinospica acidithermotolerans]MBR7827148.1 hypothetical protein [Actinospica acidithermotolerans]
MSTTSVMLKASFRVLREHRRLLVLPALSITAEAVVGASFAVPYIMTGHGSSADATHLTPATDVLLGLFSLIATTISLFFSAALFLAVADAMNGDEVRLKTALRGALRRLPTIFAWAIVSCTVSLVVRTIDKRVPLSSLVLSISWTCVSMLALPMMIFEGVGAVEGVRRSMAVFKSTWREQAIGTMRLGVYALLMFLPALLVFVAGLTTADGPDIVLSIAICALWLGLCSLIVSCLNGVYRVAVYRFATTGVAPEHFSALGLGKAFR